MILTQCNTTFFVYSIFKNPISFSIFIFLGVNSKWFEVKISFFDFIFLPIFTQKLAVKSNKKSQKIPRIFPQKIPKLGFSKTQKIPKNPKVGNPRAEPLIFFEKFRLKLILEFWNQKYWTEILIVIFELCEWLWEFTEV